EYFDQRRLLRIFKNHRRETMESLIERTLEEVRRFSGDEAFLDDVCLVAVEIEQIKAESASVEHAHS
ncbi:MAG TPA: hypothetical protein VNQ90_20165, partial [Chthoniobacteraceae bacterium]|nr:hypothetical protein [Chthoniobacteraceae bacterium]